LIQIFSPEDSKDFYKYIDMPTKQEIRGTREYVVRTHSGALLISFHWLDESAIVLYANEERCSIMTDNAQIAEKAAQIDDEEGNGLHELFAFFLSLTASDIGELQELEDRVEDLEDILFTDGKPNRGGIDLLVQYRKEILRKKRYYEQMELLSDELADLDESFNFIDKKFDRLYDFILRTQEYVEQVREEYQSQIDIDQNNTMKILTVATTIFLPLQLITGWFGMNLLMPEFKWSFGYTYVIILSVIVVIAEILFFKHKKWF